MADAVSSRGPDDAGYWIDDAGIALGHRRLAILDLSPAGAQPMRSACGRYVMVFNGEIYNHLELRRQLKSSGIGTSDDNCSRSGVQDAEQPIDLMMLNKQENVTTFATSRPSWRGHSDTETLLAGFTAWGIRATIARCIGMFAFAVWDRVDRVLTLGRDRLGEKPLYYGWQGQGGDASFLFGSDLRALKVHPAFAGQVNRDALALYMRHNVVPAPHSIYQGVHKLLPGHLLTVSMQRRHPRQECYWSFPQVAQDGVSTLFLGSEEEAVDSLEQLLMDAVRQQMVADVPLGAFLSGGIDSSTIVALMQAQSSKPTKTFSIGFEEEAYNEATYAKAVASHLGTEHTELYVTSRQALNVIPHLPKIYSEPFADSSQIPTYLVAQLARENVTVALSGDAGDELFSGYSRYLYTKNIWNKVKPVPTWLRRRLIPALTIASQLPLGKSAIRARQVAALLSARLIDEFYLDRVTHWEPDSVVLGAQEPVTHLRGAPLPFSGLDEVQRMMALDTITYLPDDVLTKVDRAAMAVSLETRVPFLDHRVVEFAWRLPQSMKFSAGAGKRILRQVLLRHVPKALVERPKMGFGVPIGTWLRGPLRDWAESLLDESHLRTQEFLDPAPIRRKWKEHLTGRYNWQYPLWDVLMFQAWLDNQQ